MMNKWIASLVCCITLTISSSALAEDPDFSFATAEKLYESGKCAEHDLSKVENSRHFILMMLSDVLLWSLPQKSVTVTGAMVGNIRSFSIGRDVNPRLEQLQNYALRKDVKETIREDMMEMTRQYEEIGIVAEYPLNLNRCELYLLVSGKGGAIMPELNKYMKSLSARRMGANIEQLRDLTGISE